MAKGDRFWRRQEQRLAVNEAEKDGIVADSMEVRKALMLRVTSGEITLEEAQDELKRIKREAKKAGKITRSQAYSGRY